MSIRPIKRLVCAKPTVEGAGVRLHRERLTLTRGHRNIEVNRNLRRRLPPVRFAPEGSAK
jgi:hypothetical protein